MGQTTNYEIPYPEQDDPRNIPEDMKGMAESIDTLIKNLSTAISTIIETGSNSNGSWIKYDNGIMICFKRVTGTVEIKDSYYGIYRTADDKYFNLGDYPVPFVGEMPILSVQFYGGNHQWIGAMQNRSLTHVADLLVLSQNSGSKGAYYDAIAIGRWK